MPAKLELGQDAKKASLQLDWKCAVSKVSENLIFSAGRDETSDNIYYVN